MKLRLVFCLGLLGAGVLGFWFAQNYFYQAGELRLIPTLRLADGSVYAGAIDDKGMLSGNGRLDWENGRSYVGDFKQGLFNGQGIYVGATGLTVAGQFEDGLLSGFARIDHPNGTSYQGELQRDLMHGRGKLQLANGNSWEGDFSEDQITGSGTWSQKDGTVYIGQMLAGEFHGRGEITDPNNNRYVGQFRDGKRHGQGIFSAADGTQYSGDFVDNDFFGSGTITRLKPASEYVGAVANWQPEGKGITTIKGRQLSGVFKDGKLDGQGEYFGLDGQHYQGGFKQGQYSGQGVWIDKVGNRYQGTFEYNDFHGEGHYTFAEPVDGISSYSGIWERGRLVSGDDQLVIHTPENISEHFLYQQTAQLEVALDRLAIGDPQQIELYTLALGPYGDQEVFSREIRYLETAVKQLNIHQNRGLFLANSRRHLDQYPLATVTSLRRGIEQIASRMDSDQDILFLYLTTHGSPEHVLSFDQSGMDLPDLSVDQLGQMLDSSGIKWKVVVLSACYSGGFIDRLKNDHTLIFTAAAADKTSFGCDDNSRFTYFGEAFFRHGLANSSSFSEAFDQAVKLIAEWEQQQELEPSNPQSHQPQPILDQLNLWRASKAGLGSAKVMVN